MRLGSVCSGVGGMDMGLEAAGFAPAWFCEKDAQCRIVLKHHWPNVPIYDDLEGLADRDGIERVDLLAGGTPCQDLSVAGRRAGLDGERSGLFFEFIRLADALAPDWLLWENVDGALSSQQGEDFAVCLEGFTGFRPQVPEEGWRSAGVCVGPLRWCVWRVLDAQWFGVAQRRARVFVVAGTGASPRPEVLLEPESVSGDSAPSRTARERAADDVALCLRGKGNASHRADSDTYVPMIANAVTAREAKGVNPAKGVSTLVSVEVGSLEETLVVKADGVSPATAKRECSDVIGTPSAVDACDTGQVTDRARASEPSQPMSCVPHVAGQDAYNDLLVAHTLREEGFDASEGPMAFDWQSGGDVRSTPRPRTSALGSHQTPAVYGTLRQNYRNNSDPMAEAKMIVGVIPRRLTPRECSRLMSWPTDWLDLCGEGDDAANQEAAAEDLHRLWRAVRATPTQVWEDGGLRMLLAPEVLLAGLFVGWLSWEVAAECAETRRTLPGENAWPEGFVRRLRQEAGTGSAPCRRESLEQCARELGRPLPFLSHEAASASPLVWYPGLLQAASPEWAVRHARPAAEGCSAKRKALADSPRYRMIGNGVVANVSAWIGRRIMQAIQESV